MNMQVTILTLDILSEIHRAVENAGRELVLIRNNEIIGEAYGSASRDGVIAVEMRDDAAKALVADSALVKMWEESFPEKKFKYATFHFSMLTGEYIGENEEEYTPDALMDVCIVDKFNLRFGMVPSTFKEVAGYNAIEHETANEPD